MIQYLKNIYLDVYLEVYIVNPWELDIEFANGLQETTSLKN